MSVVGLALISPQFDWGRVASERPTLAACGLMVTAGLGFGLMAWSMVRGAGPGLGAVIGLGLALRLLLAGSTPIWEDDFHRYLWDGAAVARGLDPYRVSPLAASSDDAPPAWRGLAGDFADLRQRVNHPQFRTLYPAVAQSAFVTAWTLYGGVPGLRVVLLAAEGIGVWLLVTLLGRLGRPPTWCALYWLNPLAMVSFVNAVHFDALLVPLILGGALAMGVRKPGVGSALIGLAAGVKLWPILLWPLMMRIVGPNGPVRWGVCAVFAGGIFVLSIAPILAAGLGPDAGLVAYAETWTRNSAVHPLLFDGATALIRGAGLIQDMDPERVVRMLLGLAGATIALVLAARAEPGRLDAGRLLLLAALILALAPAQYPWYGAAILPLAALAGAWRIASAAAVVSAIYYLRFVLDEEGALLRGLVWVEHLTLWTALALDLRRPSGQSAGQFAAVARVV